MLSLLGRCSCQLARYTDEDATINSVFGFVVFEKVLILFGIFASSLVRYMCHAELFLELLDVTVYYVSRALVLSGPVRT